MLPLMFTLALNGSPAAAPPNGVYSYVASIAGQPLGKLAVTVTRDAAGSIHLQEEAGANYGGQTQTAQDAMSLDGNLVPISYAATYTRSGAALHTALAFKGDTATETSDSGSKPFALTPNLKHFAVLDGTMFAGYFALPAQMQAWNDAPVLAVAPMFGQSFPVALDAALKPDRPKTVPANDSQISISSPVQFSIWYDPKTLVVDEMDVPAQNATIVRTAA